MLIGPLGTNFSEVQIGIQTFSYKKMHLKLSSVIWRPFCLGLNVLTYLNTFNVLVDWNNIKKSFGKSFRNVENINFNLDV